MRRIYVVVMIILSVSMACSLADHKDEKVELNTFVEKSSYVLGLDAGNSLKKIEAEIDIPSFIHGIEDNLHTRELLMTSHEIAAVKKSFSGIIQQKHSRNIKALAEKNLKEGEAFLEENKKKEGVVTTESGLQYIVLEEGHGPTPKLTDTVTFHYTAKLIDGKKFDSSYDRNKPDRFKLNDVFPGWSEGLQLMKKKSLYRFFIPPNLAYGEKGINPVVGPNSTLIFEVELMEINEQPYDQPDNDKSPEK